MLPIYFEENLVGHIEDETAGISFAYAKEWLERPDVFAISLLMPLREEPYSPKVATPWFANLLPEERQLERIGRLLGRGQSDVYGLLEQIGRDTAGALSVGIPEPPDQASYRPLSDAELADALARLPERPLLVGEEGVTMSLAGAQSKLPVAIFDGQVFLPQQGAASTHILKPEGDRLYATVENELLCMALANRLGLTVAPVSMGIAGERHYLIVERYDRESIANRRAVRKHQEDFCQALGLYPTEKYETRRGPGLADLFAVVDRHARRPALDRLQLLDLTIFACCIGDTDRHGKNYSLMLTDGGPRLAPGYDLLSSLAYENITRNLAMKIADKNRAEYLELRHWQRFAQMVGLAPASTVRRVTELASQVALQVTDVAGELHHDYPANKDALMLFSERIYTRAATIARNARKGPTANKDTEAKDE